MRFVLLAVLAACGGSGADSSGAGSGSAGPTKPIMSTQEIQRAHDACGYYAKKVCACAETVSGAKDLCKLSSALVDSVRVGTEVGLSPDSSEKDVKQANSVVRKTVAECIEQTAKLAALGCP